MIKRVFRLKRRRRDRELGIDLGLKVQALNSGDRGPIDNNENSIVLKVTYTWLQARFKSKSRAEESTKLLRETYGWIIYEKES